MDWFLYSKKSTQRPIQVFRFEKKAMNDVTFMDKEYCKKRAFSGIKIMIALGLIRI
jgi:hypothetical protein